MNRILLRLVYLLLLLSASFSYAGERGGNGGDARVYFHNTPKGIEAREKSMGIQRHNVATGENQNPFPADVLAQVKEVRLFDLIEAEPASGYIEDEGKAWEVIRDEVVNKSFIKNRIFGEHLKSAPKNLHITNYNSLPEIYDEGIVPVMDELAVDSQIAVQTEAGTLFIHAKLFELMSPLHKAALYIHEYLWFLSPYGTKNSIEIRTIVREMFRRDFESAITPLEWYIFLKKRGFGQDKVQNVIIGNNEFYTAYLNRPFFSTDNVISVLLEDVKVDDNFVLKHGDYFLPLVSTKGEPYAQRSWVWAPKGKTKLNYGDLEYSITNPESFKYTFWGTDYSYDSVLTSKSDGTPHRAHFKAGPSGELKLEYLRFEEMPYRGFHIFAVVSFDQNKMPTSFFTSRDFKKNDLLIKSGSRVDLDGNHEIHRLMASGNSPDNIFVLKNACTAFGRTNSTNYRCKIHGQYPMKINLSDLNSHNEIVGDSVKLAEGSLILDRNFNVQRLELRHRGDYLDPEIKLQLVVNGKSQKCSALEKTEGSWRCVK